MKDVCRYYDPTQEWFDCTLCEKRACKYQSCKSMAVCPDWKPKKR